MGVGWLKITIKHVKQQKDGSSKSGVKWSKTTITHVKQSKSGNLKGGDKWVATTITHVKQPKNGNLKAGGKWSKTKKNTLITTTKIENLKKGESEEKNNYTRTTTHK